MIKRGIYTFHPTTCTVETIQSYFLQTMHRQSHNLHTRSSLVQIHQIQRFFWLISWTLSTTICGDVLPNYLGINYINQQKRSICINFKHIHGNISSLIRCCPLILCLYIYIFIDLCVHHPTNRRRAYAWRRFRLDLSRDALPEGWPGPAGLRYPILCSLLFPPVSIGWILGTMAHDRLDFREFQRAINLDESNRQNRLSRTINHSKRSTQSFRR